MNVFFSCITFVTEKTLSQTPYFLPARNDSVGSLAARCLPRQHQPCPACHRGQTQPTGRRGHEANTHALACWSESFQTFFLIFFPKQLTTLKKYQIDFFFCRIYLTHLFLPCVPNSLVPKLCLGS